MRVFTGLLLLVCMHVGAFAQTGDIVTDTIKTKVPKNTRFLEKLIGLTSDSAEKKIKLLGYRYSLQATPYWEESDKIYYRGYEGNTSSGRWFQIGLVGRKTSVVASVSYNAFKEEYYGELSASLISKGYQKREKITKVDDSYSLYYEIFEKEGEWSYKLAKPRKGFFEVEIITPEASKWNRGWK